MPSQHVAVTKGQAAVVLGTSVLLLGSAIAIGLAVDADPGTLPDWVSALSALAAFVAAVFAGWFAFRLVQIEHQRDVDRDEAALRQHAELVAAWGTTERDFRADGEYWLAAVPSATVWVRNISLLPVHDVRIEGSLKIFVEGQEAASETILATPPLIAPGDSYHIGLVEPFGKGVPVGVYPSEEHLEHTVVFDVSVTFTDGTGHHWRRDTSGGLLRL